MSPSKADRMKLEKMANSCEVSGNKNKLDLRVREYVKT